MELHPGQREIFLDWIKNEKDPSGRWFIVRAGRRWGKSFLASFIAFIESSLGKSVAIISLHHSQLDTFADKIIGFCNQLGVPYNYNKQAKILYVGENPIKFYPEANLDRMRGEGFDVLILDEFDFYREGYWKAVILPTLATSECPGVLIISTPRLGGLMQELEKDQKWRVYHHPSYDNPYISADYIEAMKDEMDENTFKREILALYVAAETALFDNIEKVPDHQPVPPYFVGIDLAMKRDYSAVVVLDSQMIVVDYIYFNNVSHQEAVEIIKSFVSKYLPVSIYIEGNAYISLAEDIKLGLKNIGASVDMVYLNARKKGYMISLLLKNRNKIKFKKCDGEMEKEIFSFNVVRGEGMGSHDDLVIALGYAVMLFEKHKKVRIL